MQNTSEVNESDRIYIHIIKSYTNDFYECRLTESGIIDNFGNKAASEIMHGIHHALYIERTVPGVIK